MQQGTSQGVKGSRGCEIRYDNTKTEVEMIVTGATKRHLFLVGTVGNSLPLPGAFMYVTTRKEA